MKTDIILSLAIVQLVGWETRTWGQGNLIPPGPPAPTMKSLDQVEPRTPIASLPYTISQPGSYYVTTNLTGSSGTNGITISANDVTLDLMGFEVVGVPLSSVGILLSGSRANICVRNGTVRDWQGLAGVSLSTGDKVTVEDLRVIQNLNTGLLLGPNSAARHCAVSGSSGNGFVTGSGATIRDCTVIGNGSYGLTGGDGSTISDTAVNQNGGGGIVLSDNCVIKACSVIGNGNGAGISVGKNCLVQGCNALNNQTTGIATGYGCQVRDCVSSGNGLGILGSGISANIRSMVDGCTTVSNRAYGISIGGDSVVTACHASQNGQGSTAAGIYTAGTGSRIDGSHCRDNIGWGIQATTGDIIIRNSAGNNASGNYSPSSGANFGAVQSPSVTTNASPWANFIF